MDTQKRAKEHPLFTQVLKNYRNKEKQFKKKNSTFLELSIFSFRNKDLLQQNETHYLHSGKSMYTMFFAVYTRKQIEHLSLPSYDIVHFGHKPAFMILFLKPLEKVSMLLEIVAVYILLI